MIYWKNSISGYYNPYKHKGLNAEELFSLWINRVGRRSTGTSKRKYEYELLYVWSVKNHKKIINFISQKLLTAKNVNVKIDLYTAKTDDIDDWIKNEWSKSV